MKLFIGDINREEAFLTPEESHHLAKVMRLKIADTVYVTNGNGLLVKGVIANNSDKKASVTILETFENYQKRDYNLHIAIAPTKNIDRLEYFLEKATEIGIDQISLIICHNSERQIVNEERLRKIILAATKQSLKAYLPKLNPTTTFEQFINQDLKSQCLIAHCNNDERKLDLKKATLTNDVCIMIGPEGDFSHQEITMTENKNYQSISLGNQRMRTETAALYSVFAINYAKN